MMIEKEIHSDLPIPPGEYLEEVLKDFGMSKEELARRMDRPASKLSLIFKGEKAITPDTALRLEKVLGVPAHIWLGLEAEYRLVLARQEKAEREERLKEEAKYVSKYPYRDLVRFGEIKPYTRATDKARALQNYLGVMSLTKVPELNLYQVTFRIGASRNGERTPEAVAAWLRMGERRAHKVKCKQFDRERLRMILSDLKALTTKPPEEFQEPLQQKLANCGVALVICPHFSKTKAHGAVFWMGRDKAVLMITIRGKWADIFWFSLFHEIGHIILHGRQEVILEDDGGDQQEKEANTFASDILIPPDAYKTFVQRDFFSEDNIKRFACDIGIDPGIVVGRLQHDGKLRPQWGNNMRSRYDLKN